MDEHSPSKTKGAPNDVLDSPLTAGRQWTSRTGLSASAPSLRFPKPLGSQELALWLFNSSPGEMRSFSAMTDDSSDFGDHSPYDVINTTDNESQEDNLSESTTSLDAARPDDVRSLASEGSYPTNSDSETDSDDQPTQGSSSRYAGHVLRNSSTTLVAKHKMLMPELMIDRDGSRVIEFQEGDDDAMTGYISVKHTIREFSEDDSAMLMEDMEMPAAPKRLVATVQQTMALGCLSSRLPLRVLYVGCPSGEKDIVKKMASAICACNVAYPNTGGVYNIFQVSSFLSSQEPEVDLLETSPFQIKVERCKFAETKEGQCYLTTEDGRTYLSSSRGRGSVIRPEWTLPHIAIFYCSENDSHFAVRTRHAAWKFMTRHGIPSVFISQRQSFTQAKPGFWKDYIDPNGVHMCVESRDAQCPMVPQRFPIDLQTFINIDARQMNRNLTFLTGLTEVNDQGLVADDEDNGFLDEMPKKVTLRTLIDHFQGLNFDQWSCFLTVLFTVLVSYLFILSGVAQRVQLAGSGQADQLPVTAALPGTQLSGAVSSAVVQPIAIATSTTTVTADVTTTRTVRAAEPMVNTLAAVRSTIAGLLSEKPSADTIDGPAKPNNLYSVNLYSKNEMLLKLPPGNKAAWLSKGAIDIEVYRGGHAIKSRLSSADEGIIIEISKEHACGPLNISVVTTRRPKINETFEVNFGTDRLILLIQDKLRTVTGAVSRVVDTADEAVHGLVPSLVAKQALNRVKDSVGPQVTRCMAQVMRLMEQAHGPLHKPLEAAEDIRDRMKLSILHAQIWSRLRWLQLRGEHEQYEIYERKAEEYSAQKLQDLRTLREQRREEGGRVSRNESASPEPQLSRWRKLVTG